MKIRKPADVKKPILTFTIDFETAKRYREANKMPTSSAVQRGPT